MFKQRVIEDMSVSEFADFVDMVYKFHYKARSITFSDAFLLWKYSNELHYITIKACNYVLNRQAEARRSQLEFLITDLLKQYDCIVEFNRDPRSYSVNIYLNTTTVRVCIGDCEYNERGKIK